MRAAHPSDRFATGSRRMFIPLTLLGSLILLVACAGSRAATEADHGPAHDHDHDAWRATAWSDRHEALLDIGPAEAGHPLEVTLYLTRLADHTPVGQGPVILSLTHPASRRSITATAARPVRPGVFRFSPTLDRGGHWEPVVTVPGPPVDSLALPLLDLHDHRPGAASTPFPGPTGGDGPDHAGCDGHDHDHSASAGPDHAGCDGHDHDHSASAGPDHAGCDGHDHAHSVSAGPDHAGCDGHDHPHPPGPRSGGTVAVRDACFPGVIELVKEQQWAVGFDVQPVGRRSFHRQMTVPGELMAVPRSEAVVTAPLAGRLSLAHPFPAPGQRVRAGEVLAVLIPPPNRQGDDDQLRAALAEARVRLAQAEVELSRAERLYESRVGPLRRVEDARFARDAAQAALPPLAAAVAQLPERVGAEGLTLRAPFGGTVVEVLAPNGAGVEAGAPLLRLVNNSVLWLRADLPATEASRVEEITVDRTTFRVEGRDEPVRPRRLVQVGEWLEPGTRTLPVHFEVDNADRRFKLGQYARVDLQRGAAFEAVAVPDAALLTDEGLSFVFVQRGGERFERREVTVASRVDGWAGVIAGLRPGERVVTRGVYYVKLAAMPGGAADPHAGHAH